MNSIVVGLTRKRTKASILEEHTQRKADIIDCLISIAENRKARFGTYNIRLDRHLYHDCRSLVRIYFKFCKEGIIENDPDRFRVLNSISEELLDRGYEKYPEWL